MPKRILIVDDESDLVETLKFRLEGQGYEILTAYDGQEGLNKARSARPDLILLDLMLPRLDGYKVAKMLKLDAQYKSIPIIMLTARVQESDEKLGYECGADAYITKPFDPKMLLEKISLLLKS